MNNGLLREAWDLLEDVVPLAVDCGTVCDGRCCRPRKDRLGMLLFPGEEELLGNEDGFSLVPHPMGTLLLCSGRCDRKKRPLACRMFPLFPVLTESGRVKAVYDGRGFAECPLIHQASRVRLQPEFVRQVRRAGRVLIADGEYREFIQRQGEEIALVNRLTGLDEVRSPIKKRK